MEVSSYQLEIPNKCFFPSVSRAHLVFQTFIRVVLLPASFDIVNFQVAVILNLTPDHLERHKSMKNYSMIKCRVFSHMSDRKIAILPTGTKSNSFFSVILHQVWLEYVVCVSGLGCLYIMDSFHMGLTYSTFLEHIILPHH